ncbi:MAG: hypothetical protein AB1602_07915, partial [Elusimicrobiota bacterium]
MPSVKLIKKQKIGSSYKKLYDKPTTPLMRLYNYNKNDCKINEYIKLKQRINSFELINRINKILDEVWQSRSIRVIMDREKERLKRVEDLLKK